MAQGDQNFIRALIRSIDKKLEWEAIQAQNDSMRLLLRHAHAESSMDIPRTELLAAMEGGIAQHKLRERIKRARRGIYENRRPYMPWRLPKIEAVGAPPRAGGGMRPRR